MPLMLIWQKFDGKGEDGANGGFELMDIGGGWIWNEGIGIIVFSCWFVFEISWMHIFTEGLGINDYLAWVFWLEWLDVIRVGGGVNFRWLQLIQGVRYDPLLPHYIHWSWFSGWTMLMLPLPDILLVWVICPCLWLHLFSEFEV